MLKYNIMCNVFDNKINILLKYKRTSYSTEKYIYIKNEIPTEGNASKYFM